VPTAPPRAAAPPPPPVRRPPPPPLPISAAAEPSEPIGVQLVRHSLRSWTERVRPALLQNPTENNLLVSLGDWGHPALRLLAAHAVDGAPQVAVAFTPGQPAVVAHLDPKVSPERGAALLRRAEPAHSWPAVYGPVALVQALVQLLQAAPTIGGGPLRPKPLQLWMECRSAGPAPSPGGWMRPARRLDIGTLLPMVVAFSAETGEQDDTAESEGAISWLKPRVEAKAVWVWERPTPPLPGVRRGGADDPGENELVAMVVRSPPTAGRVRLSSVFTRGVDRGRGYAAALVGALTADTLAMSGVHGVILLVDSLNHAARRLYERLGYEARGELARYERLPTT